MENNQEQERIENLLKPRYKVIADYPNSQFALTMIIDFSQHERYLSGNVMGNQFEKLSFFDSYPAIFKPMSWYEERTVEEMPEYVSKLLHGSKVVLKISGKEFLDDAFMKWQFGNYKRNDFKPATLEEYTTYIKQ